MTQQVSRRPIKCQSRSWSQRCTKVNGSHHGDPLLKPIGIKIVTKSLPGPATQDIGDIGGNLPASKRPSSMAVNGASKWTFSIVSMVYMVRFSSTLYGETCSFVLTTIYSITSINDNQCPTRTFRPPPRTHWSLVDVPLIFFCPADHVPDWEPRVLLGMVEARSVNVKKTTTTTTTVGGQF